MDQTPRTRIVTRLALISPSTNRICRSCTTDTVSSRGGSSMHGSF